MSDRRQLGRYKILKELGRGGMGIVYQAEDEMLGRTVALKTVPQTPAQSGALHDRLLREARLGARLDHPCVIRLHDIGQDDGLTYLVLEYVEGRTLRDVLSEVGTMRMSDALRIFRDIAEGVGHAHDLGIIHRDLKPENVMVTPQGRAKVMDFGLAWQADQARLTQTGAIMGTLAYFSPEQARGQAADARSDLYSMGAILFELLSGHWMFEATSPAEMIVHHLQTAPRSVRDLVPLVPVELDTLIMRCMQKEPSLRYGSAREVLDILDRVKDNPVLAPRTPRPAVAPANIPTHMTFVPPPSPVPTVVPENPQWGALQRKLARMEEANIAGISMPPSTQPTWGPLQRGGPPCPDVVSVPMVPRVPKPSPTAPPPELTTSSTFDAEYRQAKAAIDERRWDDAERHLLAAVRHNARDARPYRHLAALYARQDKVSEAIKACHTGLGLAPDHARMRALLGDLLARSGSTSEAIAAYQEAVRKRPDLADAWRSLGRLCVAKDRVNDAVRAFEALVQMDSKDLDAARSLPSLYLRQSKPDKAEQAARAALKLSPRDALLRVDLALALEAKKNPLAAAQLLREAATLDPKAASPWETLVKLHLRHGATVAARATLEEALEHHPLNARLLWQMGELVEAEGNQGGALDYFERALSAVPAVATALQKTASVDPASELALQRALEADHGDVQSAILLGRLYVKQRQGAGGVALLQHALRISPNEMMLHFLLGQCRRQIGQKDGAIRSFRRAWERLRATRS